MPAAPAPRRARPGADGRGQVRIIGGRWRGRRLPFPDAPALRPTPDRVRETLFNWLQFEIVGRRCLDLFAGSGALGFEALSRGAAEVVFVENQPAVAVALRNSLRLLGSDDQGRIETVDSSSFPRGRVEAVDSFSFLRSGCAGAPFDVVFIDPPYDQRWLGRACAALEAGGWLAPGAFIYLEDAAAAGAPELPQGWSLLRSKKAGDVGYHLARRGAGSATAVTDATTTD